MLAREAESRGLVVDIPGKREDGSRGHEQNLVFSGARSLPWSNSTDDDQLGQCARHTELTGARRALVTSDHHALACWPALLGIEIIPDSRANSIMCQPNN
jgi:hypothetical protein